MSDRLRARAEAAVAGYRRDRGAEHLRVLRQDGWGRLADSLTREAWLPPDMSAEARAYIEDWLAGG